VINRDEKREEKKHGNEQRWEEKEEGKKRRDG